MRGWLGRKGVGGDEADQKRFCVDDLFAICNYKLLHNEVIRMTDIGHAIMVRRAMLKMTQGRLARVVGINQSYISLIENGERPLTDDLLQKIAAALGCEPEDLTKWQQAA
jgi:DNA-binding Xre family transcriptional regulator